MIGRRWASRAALVLFLGAAQPALAIQPHGGETAVHSPGAVMSSPAVESQLHGSYVVTWAQETAPGGPKDIYKLSFAADGTPQGAPVRVNSHLPGDQSRPAIGMSRYTGDYVIVWQSDAQDGDGYGIYGRRYAAGGALLGDEFRVNTRTKGDQLQPTVGMDDNGAFVVAFAADINGAGSDRDIFYQRYDANGAAIGNQGNVSSLAPGDAETPSIAVDISGFTVAWANHLEIETAKPDSPLRPYIGFAWQDVYTIHFRKYLHTGLAQDTGTMVANSLRSVLTPNAPRLLAPRVVGDGIRHYVAWQRGDDPHNGEITIEVQAYGKNLRNGPRMSLDEAGAELMAPALTLHPVGGGEIMLAWVRRVPGINPQVDVYRQGFSLTSLPKTNEVAQRVNTTTLGHQVAPALPSVGSFWNLPVAWQGPGNDPAASVYVQRYGY